MARFKARDLRDGTGLDEIRRTLNEIQKEIASDIAQALGKSRVTELIIDGPYAAGYGQVVRVAPPSGGLRVILPAVNLEQPGARVVVVVEGSAGALSVEAIDTTVNGTTTVTYLAGLGTVEFQLTPAGWYGWSASLISVPLTSLASQAADTFVGNVTAGSAAPTAVALSTLAGAGLAFGTHTLDVTGSTSITIASDQVQRAALTGEVTASANANGTTVTRSTDFQTSPWTGNHQFNGEIRGGTLTSLSTSGALNVTLDAGATRLLFTSASDITLGTISGAADGRLLFLEHTGTGTLTITHDASTANAVSCPNNADFVLTSRGALTLMARGSPAVWKMMHYGLSPEHLVGPTAGGGILFALRTAFTAAAAGSADDVTIYSANAPLAFRLLDVIVLISTAIGGSTVQLRDTSGGGGSVLSSSLSSAATGTARNNDTTTRVITVGGSIFLRRSDRGVAGEVIIIGRHS